MSAAAADGGEDTEVGEGPDSETDVLRFESPPELPTQEASQALLAGLAGLVATATVTMAEPVARVAQTSSSRVANRAGEAVRLDAEEVDRPRGGGGSRGC